MAVEKPGVEGRPIVGEGARLAADDGPPNIDPGRAKREGERPVGGKGDDERVIGTDEPVYFFWMSVREKMA
jgi:hypothetical protein